MRESKPWTWPLVVAALVLPVIAGFAVGGPALGLAIGALATAAVILYAARLRPDEGIAAVAAGDDRRHVLVAISRELDDPAAIEQLTSSGELADAGEDAEILVLAPARSGTLSHWAGDLRAARAEAQRKLVITAASLGKADVAVDARVGDADLVQAIEDQLRSFPATDVILVTGSAADDPRGARAASELEQRLELPLSRVVVEGP